jgi:hypothetical protein
MACAGLCSYSWDTESQSWYGPTGRCIGETGCGCPAANTIPPPFDLGSPAVAVRLCTLSQLALASSLKLVQIVYFEDEIDIKNLQPKVKSKAPISGKALKRKIKRKK